ncbi:hypothetical protein AND_005074 [Anopheles darlingi]|uniref:Uncharacterized protein n=1 Tax=Anopheles darlingi TaxID=43151 RepID=W5JIT5_ANODA|nr:hypothetical protein AND_005074 [Anopheles darlingi]
MTITTYGVDKCPDKFDEYRCTLPERYRKLANEQLREDELIRKQALDQMRQWIAKHPYIRRCRTDAVFLLRFLRQRKFSIPKACEMLERYLALRQSFPHWFQGLDPCDKTMMSMGDEDVFHVLGFDAKGQIVILIKSRNFRVDKYDLVDLIRFMHMNVEVLSCDEMVQVAGVVLVVDCHEATMAHFTLFRLSEMRHIGPYINQLLPIRCREIHVIRLPKVAASIVDLLFTYISPKLKHRFFVRPPTVALRNAIRTVCGHGTGPGHRGVTHNTQHQQLGGISSVTEETDCGRNRPRELFAQSTTTTATTTTGSTERMRRKRNRRPAESETNRMNDHGNDRQLFHKTMNEAVNHLGKELLPCEYTNESEDPKSLTHVFAKRLHDGRDQLRSLDNMEIDIAKFSSVWNKSQPNGYAPGGIDAGMVGSFRKLDID